MTRAFLTFLIILFLSFDAVLAQQAIIPQPVSSEPVDGQLTIESEIGVVLDQENDLISKMLSNFASDLEPLGIEVNSGSGAESCSVCFASHHPEGGRQCQTWRRRI